MDIKYRSAPLEGYITDAAGNVLRNTTIRIKEEHPGGLVSDIESVKTDNNGYYVSSPLKKGIYAVFDGGVRLSRRQHNPQFNFEIPAFAPNAKAAPEVIMSAPATQEIIDTLFLQIEPDDRDADKYDHVFEVFNRKAANLRTGFSPFIRIPETYFVDNGDNVQLISNRRFDVIYADEVTGANVLWLGVPAIVYDNKQNTQLVLPLDQFSHFPKRLKVLPKTTQSKNPFVPLIDCPTMNSWIVDAGGIATLTTLSTDASYAVIKTLSASLSLGDIVMLSQTDTPTPSTVIWMRLIYKTISSTTIVLSFQNWLGRPAIITSVPNKKSKYLIGNGSQTLQTGTIAPSTIKALYIYDGMTNAMNVKTTVSQPSIRRRFFVYENQSASTMLSADRMPYDNEMFGYELL